MRVVLAILLMLSISYQFVAKVGLVVWYKTNTEYITQKFCENKDKPKLQCNGKCYLSKQLAKVDKQSDSNSEKEAPVKLPKVEIPAYLSIQYNQFSFTDIREAVAQLYRSPNYHFNHISSCFHPPDVC